MLAYGVYDESFLEINGTSKLGRTLILNRRITDAVNSALRWNSSECYQFLDNEMAEGQSENANMLANAVFICSLLNDVDRGLKYSRSIIHKYPYEYELVNLATFYLANRGFITESAVAQNSFVQSCGYPEHLFALRAASVISNINKYGICEAKLQQSMRIAYEVGREMRKNFYGVGYFFHRRPHMSGSLCCSIRFQGDHNDGSALHESLAVKFNIMNIAVSEIKFAFEESQSTPNTS